MKVIKKICRVIRNIIILLFLSSIAAVVMYKYVPVHVTPLMVIRCVEQVSRGEKLRLHHHWVPLDSIANSMAVAVIASEDQNFEKHNGFDLKAIEKAVEERQTRGRVRGASTISQQTAKNVFLWPSSSWVRKGFEVYFTGLIELVWGKERIMEVYLNSIEMGDGIYGAEAVARLHFNRSAERLSKQQCALIAATLPNPLKMNSAQPSRYLIKRQGEILKQMSHFQSFPSPPIPEKKKTKKSKGK
ncbi:MAG: monofunctional biosynthetic peptidoglycan transglycosylase [Bacteroidaceae bacterium]|nr:monofunctional biosynthetic peptidoglycan transglycosylase [Bacteroidaceae bacterium]